MNLSWTTIKTIIGNSPKQDNLYLTLIDEDGVIACANSNMLRRLDLDNPRKVQTNFFDLLHPAHVEDFRNIIGQSARNEKEAGMELYIRNGYYHPMKWHVRSVENAEAKALYFCIGYDLVDRDRLCKFNELAKKHYQLIIEELTGIIFHDRNGELIAANQKTASLLHTTLERLYKLKDISQLWSTQWMIADEEGKALPFDESPFMKTLQTGKPQKQVLSIRTGSGEKRWFLFNSLPLQDDTLQPDSGYVISGITDVTREKQLMQQLDENKAIIDSFIRQTPNMAWVIDEERKLKLASGAFYEYFELNEEKSFNRPMSELVPGFIYEALYEQHMKVIETGKPATFVEKIKLANGLNYDSHIYVFPIESAPGIKLVGGYAVNIPDTKSIEAELREVNGRLLTLTNAASNAIWEWDMQTGKVFRNKLLMDMIGYQSGDDKGLTWWLRRIHPEDRNRVSDKVKEATENNKQSWQDEYRFRCADGTYKHVQDKGFVIYENGLPVKMVGSLHDISDLKELENKLADERIQRQKEITETIIQVQEKERTRIGHELHDNVNQILSTAFLFIDTMIPESREQRIAKDKSVEYLKLAMEEIRKLSKELVIPQFKEQGLVESIHSLIDDIQIAHPIRISFTHDVDTNLLASGKKITLFRIIQEQLKNILRHSRAKHAEILLQAKQNDVQLIIKDDGVGFDSKQTHRGIGLSNMYERVSFYNGTVDIQTEKNKGCTIVVRLSLL